MIKSDSQFDSGSQLVKQRNFLSQKEIVQERLCSLKKATIENARQCSFYEWKAMGLLSFCCLSSIVLCLAIYSNSHQLEMENAVMRLKMMVTVLTMLSLLFMALAKLTMAKIIKDDAIWNSRKMASDIIVTSVILLPHPTVWTHGWQLASAGQLYYVDDILVVCVLLRVLFLAKMLFKWLSYYGTRSMRISDMFGSDLSKDFGYYFSLKCFFKQNQKSSLTLLFLFSMLIIGQVVYILESDQNSKLQNWIQSLQFSVVSMLTVGYGDTTPNSAIGKVFTVVLIVFGAFWTALFIIYAHSMLEFHEGEVRTYSYGKRLQHKEMLEQRRKQYVEEALRRLWFHRGKSTRPRQLKPQPFGPCYDRWKKYQYDGSLFISLLQTLSQRQVITSTMISIVIDRLKESEVETVRQDQPIAPNRREDNELFAVMDEKIFNKTRRPKQD